MASQGESLFKSGKEQPENAQPLLDRQGSEDLEVNDPPTQGPAPTQEASTVFPQRSRQSSFTFPFSVNNLRLSPVAASVPELPDIVTFWDQQRGLMYAFAFMSGVSLLLSPFKYGTLAALFGLTASGLYFFDMGLFSSQTYRAKVINVVCSICGLASVVLSFFCGVLLFLLVVDPTQEAKEGPAEASLAETIVVVICYLVWYGLMGGVAISVSKKFNYMVCLSNPVSSGLAQI